MALNLEGPALGQCSALSDGFIIRAEQGPCPTSFCKGPHTSRGQSCPQAGLSLAWSGRQSLRLSLFCLRGRASWCSGRSESHQGEKACSVGSSQVSSWHTQLAQKLADEWCAMPPPPPTPALEDRQLSPYKLLRSEAIGQDASPCERWGLWEGLSRCLCDFSTRWSFWRHNLPKTIPAQKLITLYICRTFYNLQSRLVGIIGFYRLIHSAHAHTPHTHPCPSTYTWATYTPRMHTALHPHTPTYTLYPPHTYTFLLCQVQAKELDSLLPCQRSLSSPLSY